MARFDFYDLKFKADDLLFRLINVTLRIKYSLSFQRKELKKNKQYKNIQKGKKAYIVLNGPSIKSQDLKQLEGYTLFFVNRGYKHPDYAYLKPEYHVFIDPKLKTGEWPISFLDEILELNPDVTFILDVRWFHLPHFQPYKQKAKIIWVNNTLTWTSAFKRDINITQPTPSSAVFGSCFTVAAYMGFDAIFFTGFDGNGLAFEIVNQSSHFYGVNEENMHKTTQDYSRDLFQMSRSLRSLNAIADYCMDKGIAIANTTDGGLLDMFVRVPFPAKGATRNDILRRRLVFFNSHPIQYFAPMYQLMNKDNRYSLTVLYGSDESIRGGLDDGFKTKVKWDIDLLSGYKSIFLKNYSFRPGINNYFEGLVNLGVIGFLRKQPKSIVVVHGWQYITNLLIIFWAHVFGHTVCVRGESPYKQEMLKSPKVLRLRKRFFNFFFNRFVDYFLYIGKQNRKTYEYYGVSEDRLVFAPYSVDNTRFQKAAKEALLEKNELRTKLGIERDAFVIIYSGKYIEKKHPLHLLEAFYKLDNPKAWLVMIGEGELRAEMETYIKKHNLSNVILTGFINQSEMPSYYAIGDVFVMCSGNGETWGLSINEAMNFGLPIIASDMVGSADDIVIDGDNGFVYPYGNIEALTGCLKQMEVNTALRTQMGAASLRKINDYSYERIIRNLREIKRLTH